MANRRKKHRTPLDTPGAVPGSIPASASRRRLSRGKLWLFRLLALGLGPLVFFAVVETTLRLAGYGHSTAFLLPSKLGEQSVLVQNNQFGWRFFGPRLARLPAPIAIPSSKPAGTIRIFVFGESAAKGEPQPMFGLPRMLQAVLSLRHPGTRFEVVNAAMTAINSHAVLPIARDCANAEGDIWVVYLGNNEVVGPFGAGTVFGQQSLPLPVIRASLAIKATRTGQLLDSTLARLRPQPADEEGWRGMKMFLEQQVRADDPRMAAVYHHFERNLADLIRAGRRCGAGIVVSTVAVNLRDCAPFASLHRENLPDTDKSAWERHYQLGCRAQEAGRPAEATGHFQEAARIDGTFAELRFRQAECALALGQTPEALRHFRAARDLDTLRFRCDTKLNELTRKVAGGRERERVLLADAERVFAERSPQGLPGADLLYEHVHPTFEGNYLLAITLAEQVEKLLPERFTTQNNTARPWPAEADCARRLGWTDWSQLAALQAIHIRIKSAPFIGQVNHEAQLEALTNRIAKLSPALQPAGIAEARAACEAALAASPDDPVLYGQLASFKKLTDDLDGAAAAARRGLELLPSNSQAWLQLGLILVRQKKLEEASAAFQRAIELDPAEATYRQNLGQSLWTLGRREEAMTEFRRALKLRPDLSLVWINLGQVLEETGRHAEAEECFHRALTRGSQRLQDLVTLARFCRSRGWHDAAATNYAAALNAGPGDARLRLEAGQNLLTLGRRAEAKKLFAEAVRLTPEFAHARHFYGLALAQEGLAVEAEQEFREAVRLDPDLLEAQVNLGIALMVQGRSAEALSQLEAVLEQSPTNALARRYVQTLRGQPGIAPPR